MKVIKQFIRWVAYIIFGIVIITFVTMLFMFVAANVNIGGRTMLELHSDLTIAENNIQQLEERLLKEESKRWYGK